MKILNCACLAVGLLFASAVPVVAQTGSSAAGDVSPESELAARPWEWGTFLQGGVGVADRSDFHFLSAGERLGKVMTDEHLGSLFRGRFEYAGELMPYWQAFTPAPHVESVPVRDPVTGLIYEEPLPVGGGTFTGLSITPIILRWDLHPHGRFVPWVQGAGGLVYTTHKFPPDVLVQHGQPGGTSVWNFTPQFGLGLHYFVRPGRSINFAANAIHISSASLGDRNPGVNASIQFQIGYTFWTR
jgi:lipid A 3-O-deacylase